MLHVHSVFLQIQSKLMTQKAAQSEIFDDYQQHIKFYQNLHYLDSNLKYHSISKYPFSINIKIFFIFHKRLLTFPYFFANKLVNS